MDSNRAIVASNVSKVFRIGLREQTRDTLGATLWDYIRTPVRNYRKYRSLYRFDDIATNGEDSPDLVWALRDVSFEVAKGEVLGIIGHNGAGKSTLLKVLTRITPPTRGTVKVRGRVSSLLEVGTGFHPELTGRDNIYLNATILGMRKKEVDRKFDEIVDFSGVEHFLDTPVKRYSSGMRVRLAFAVAAHLEPEILVVDEVLAVGDAAFQKKCVSKMQDVGQRGNTVLFVSHNMPAVDMLCSRALLLEKGRIVKQGSTHEVITFYLNSGTGTRAARRWGEAEAPGARYARLRSVRVIGPSGQTTETVNIRDEVGIEMIYDVTEAGAVLMPYYYVYNDEGVVAFVTMEQNTAWRLRPRPVGRYVSTVWIPGNFLADGTYFVSCNLMSRDPDIHQFHERQVVAFTISDSAGEGTARGDWRGRMDGVVRPIFPWTTRREPAGEIGGGSEADVDAGKTGVSHRGAAHAD